MDATATGTAADPRAFKTFAEFYPFYLGEHNNRTCRRLHFVGSSLGLVCLAMVFVTSNPLWGAALGAVVYASGHPCPMCLCALVMNGISAVYYAFDNEDAAPFGFDSSAAYAALRLPLSPPPLPLIKLPSPIPAAALYDSQSHG